MTAWPPPLDPQAIVQALRWVAEVAKMGDTAKRVIACAMTEPLVRATPPAVAGGPV